MATPVTLKVDKYGFYLHWVDQNNEMDMLDIAVIRDTRTGKYAKIPKVSISHLLLLINILCTITEIFTSYQSLFVHRCSTNMNSR